MRVSYEGDSVAALGWVGTARQQLANLQARMAATGQTQGAFQHALSPDAYCYGYVLPTGMAAIHIVAAPGAATGAPEETTNITLPDFVSGTVIDGLIGPELPAALKFFYPTVQTALVHKELSPLVATSSERLAVGLWSAYAEELGGAFGDDQFSQYTRLKPTMYSGRMRGLVQLLMGFGWPQEKSIYDNVDPLFPEEESGVAPIAPYWETMVKGTGRQIAYDYRFVRTHGLFRSGDGSLWVIEISLNRGIVAMPLPLHAMTTRATFRDKLNTIGDVDGITAFDTFGGFPSGEPFPIGGKAWDAAVRAGRVITLRPSMIDYYSEWTPYTQGMGWAFNWNGDEAHNTAYKYGDDGVQRGAHHAIRIYLSPTGAITPPAKAESLKRAFLSVSAANRETFDAAMWKIDRMSDVQVTGWFNLLEGAKVADVYRQLDAWVAPPCATGSASLTKVSEGNLHFPAAPTGQPQVKFPDYNLGFVVSHDLRPGKASAQGLLKCDTTVHVFFLGNELKWVKLYVQPRTDPRLIETDEEACMYVGKWYWIQHVGERSIPPQFYSNDLDFREEKSPGYIRRDTKGKDLGYYEILHSGDGVGDRGQSSHPTLESTPAGYNSNDDLLWRQKWFSFYQKYTFDRGASTKAACVAPIYNREAYYFGHLDIKQYRSYQEVITHNTLTDPNFGWTKTEWDGARYHERITHETNGSNDPCGVFADEGPWVPIGALAEDVVYPRYSWYPWQADTDWVSWEDAQIRVLDVYLVSGATEGAKKIKTFTSNSGLYEGGFWFWPSPDEFGDYHYIDTTENCFGHAQSIVYQTDLNSGENRVEGAPDFPAMHAADNVVPSVTFIGVVDG